MRGWRCKAPGFRYYHKLAKLDEMFSEDMLRHYVGYALDVKALLLFVGYQGIAQGEAVTIQKKFYAKLYRLRIIEQKRFVVGGVKYTEDLKRFH